MKKSLAILCMGLTFAGCASPSAPNAPAPVAEHPDTPTLTPPTSDVIATVNGKPITAADLNKPLYEAYGMNMLLSLVQLEAAKQAAVKNHVVVTEADVQAETDLTLAAMTSNTDAGIKAQAEIDAADAKGQKDLADKLRAQMKADDLAALDQLLANQHVSRPEFDILMRTNAYLRKIVEPTLKDAINDDMLKQGFLFEYGQKVQVRHIQCNNWAEIAVAKKMLADGKDFGQVAMAVSRNARTAPLGGELRPFSREEPGLSQVFKDTAFALKEGEVSDAILTPTGYQLIQLEHKIDPKAVKFEDVKEAVRQQLHDRMLANGMNQLRKELGQDAMTTLQVTDPVLKLQYEKRLAAAKDSVKGSDEYRKKAAEEREQEQATMATQPATAPATMPASVPTTTPAAK